MAGKARVRVGDVVAIPIGDDEVAYALVVGNYHSAYYVAVYDGVYPRNGSGLAAAVSRPFVLIAPTFDAKVADGQWPVVGRMTVAPDEVPFPAYRLDDGRRQLVEDYTGTHTRRAKTSVEQGLPYRRLVSPQILENAVAARTGRTPWLSNYEALLVPPPGARSLDLFPQRG